MWHKHNQKPALEFYISCIERNGCRMLNLSDIAEIRSINGSQKTPKNIVVQNWLRSNSTIAMIRGAELQIYGKSIVQEHEHFSMEIYSEGLSVVSLRGAYGGIYAQEWIACEFLKHIFPQYVFQLNILFNAARANGDYKIDLDAVLDIVSDAHRDKKTPQAKLAKN